MVEPLIILAGQAATLTAYYNFEGNYNDYPGAGAVVDNLTATASESGISLSWDEPAGAAARGHRIYVGAKSGYPYDRVVETGPETGYELKGLKVGAQWRVRTAEIEDYLIRRERQGGRS